MKKQMITIGGIIVVLLIAGLLFWWYQKTKPSTEEIQQATKSIKTVQPDILTNKTTQKVEGLSVFGNIPVQVEKDYHHDNLFK